MAVALDEPKANAFMAVLEAEPDLLISAGTVAEALIVASGRGVGAAMQDVMDSFDFEVRAVGLVEARRVAAAYAQWGKGRHSAALNFGDCFAYALAKQHDCPLLFVGDDFAR